MVIYGSSSLRYSRLMNRGKGRRKFEDPEPDGCFNVGPDTLTTIFQSAIGSSDSSALV